MIWGRFCLRGFEDAFANFRFVSSPVLNGSEARNGTNLELALSRSPQRGVETTLTRYRYNDDKELYKSEVITAP
jgi:hypothetical protein